MSASVIGPLRHVAGALAVLALWSVAQAGGVRETAEEAACRREEAAIVQDNAALNELILLHRLTGGSVLRPVPATGVSL